MRAEDLPLIHSVEDPDYLLALDKARTRTARSGAMPRLNRIPSGPNKPPIASQGREA
jgi:hypothetical protein